MCAACSCVDAARDGAVDEDAALLGHLLGLLLAHRAAQQVGAAQRVAGQHLRDLHHLLLVQDHAIGRRQDRLQVRVQIVDRAVDLAVLAGDEVIDHARLQRSGPEQRHERHDVLEAVRLQAPDQVLHAARLELEHRGGAAGLRATRRWPRRPSAACSSPAAARRARARARLMISTAQSMMVSVRRPRKSNFTRPAASTSSLSNCVTTLRRRIVAVQRREIGQHRGRDDHAAGVHAGVARQAFERARQVDEVAGSPLRCRRGA